MTVRAKTKKLHKPSLLNQYAFLLFLLFFIFVLWGFWSSYYKSIFDPHPLAIRLHGTAMSLWCLMLISQALLIRYRKYKLHRVIGKVSYVLVPFIIWSGAHLAYMTINSAPPGSDAYYYMIALMYNSLIVFAILYGLAMWHRKRSAVHSRYMVSTIFPLITPVTDRLIYKYFDFMIPLAPTMKDGSPIVPGIGFAICDIILIILIIIDWRKHRRLTVFPFVLGLLVLYHLSVLVFYQYEFWQSVGDAIMRIPVWFRLVEHGFLRFLWFFMIDTGCAMIISLANVIVTNHNNHDNPCSNLEYPWATDTRIFTDYL